MGKRPHGEVRRSQVITTYGPGALVELPDHSVLIGGLETWQGDLQRIDEPRFVAWLRQKTGNPLLELRSPPPHDDDPRAPRTGMAAWIFPEWFLGPDRRQLDPDWTSRTGRAHRARPLVHRRDLESWRYRYQGARKKHRVVPVRFVQACINGHVSDLPWRRFVHQKGSDCGRQPIWFEEHGTTGDLTTTFVRCECGAERSLATVEGAGRPRPGESQAWAPLGYCKGKRPWLGAHASEPCQSPSGAAVPNRLLTRTATNAWFSQVFSALSLPHRERDVRARIQGVWDFLEGLEDRESLLSWRQRNSRVKTALTGIDDDTLWAVFDRIRRGRPEPAADLLEVELGVLTTEEPVGMGERDPVFQAEPIPAPGGRFAGLLERVLLIHRLREVRALTGFTRFEPPAEHGGRGLDLGTNVAALSTEANWLPAVENRGEGLFLLFNKDAVRTWFEDNEAARARGAKLQQGFEVHARDNPSRAGEPKSLPYVMLHSLAHLLITSLALECGYSSASIRERIYALDAGYGILLYTGTPGSEGTLGGLVQQGQHLARHLEVALARGRLCSNDPLCSQHDPVNPMEERFLHGAACHGCLLIPESCCEAHNNHLDRALVVPTVADPAAAFFPEPQ